jgi:hypothetical protein
MAADADLVVSSYSGRTTQKKLLLWREALG